MYGNRAYRKFVPPTKGHLWFGGVRKFEKEAGAASERCHGHVLETLKIYFRETVAVFSKNCSGIPKNVNIF